MSRWMAVGTAAWLLSAWCAPVHAQTWHPPTDAERCPSRWGATDERGSANLMGAETVLRAARLITRGEVVELGMVLHEAMGFYGPRIYNQQLKRTLWAPGSNSRAANEEIVTTELGQVGTQIDGFAHQSIGNSLYNCFQMDELATRSGFTKLGIEKIGSLMTRGVLVDVPALKGLELLGDSYEITAQDIQDALKREGLTLERGDALIVNTGWTKLWEKDNRRYYERAPGLGIGAADWLAHQNLMMVGTDTCCVEVTPNPSPQLSSPVHQILLVANGVMLVETLKLDELVSKRIYEFAFVVQPLKLKGATGSTIAPVAIH